MQQTIPARHGRAVRLKAGEQIKVINTSGRQVVDTWCFNAHDMKERMSTEDTRAERCYLIPKVGDSLLTNQRRPILTVVEDTCGVHDTLISCCSAYRYRVRGITEYHRSCADNLHEALGELGLSAHETPSPFNLWMNVPWDKEGKLENKAPASKPGDYVTLRADMDAVIVFSACPNDVMPVNGYLEEGTGKFIAELNDVHYEVLAAA